MRRRTTASLTLLLASLAHGLGADLQPGLSNLFSAWQRAVPIVSLPRPAHTNVAWLDGRWQCIERALRGPRPPHCRYAFLETIRLNADHFQLSRVDTNTVYLRADCTFIPDSQGMKIGPRGVGIEFDARGFRFDIVDADHLRLLAPPVPRPDWFILEHQDNGDLLLLKRLPEADSEEGAGAQPPNAQRTATNTAARAEQTQARVVVWGLFNTNSVQVCEAPPVVGNAVTVAGGHEYAVALLKDGTVRVWGAMDAPTRSVPDHLPPLQAVAAGYAHCVGLTKDGRVVGWGLVPWRAEEAERIRHLSDLVAVSAGLESTLVLRRDGTVAAWRTALYGERMTPIPANLSNVTAIASGYFHHLALKQDGTVVAWGLGTNDLGGFGGESGQCRVPTSATNIVAIAAGNLLSLALNSAGRVFIWGGVEEFGQRLIPAECTNVVAIACGSMHCVALRRDRTVVVWGPGASEGMPSGLSKVRLIGAGEGFTVAVTDPEGVSGNR